MMATQVVATSNVSTGKAGHTTPTGIFSDPGKAEVPRVQPLFECSDALHAAADLVGHRAACSRIMCRDYPASHGCVRMPDAFARQLFKMTDRGVHVLISRSSNWRRSRSRIPILSMPARRRAACCFRMSTLRPSVSQVRHEASRSGDEQPRTCRKRRRSQRTEQRAADPHSDYPRDAARESTHRCPDPAQRSSALPPGSPTAMLGTADRARPSRPFRTCGEARHRRQDDAAPSWKLSMPRPARASRRTASASGAPQISSRCSKRRWRSTSRRSRSARISSRSRTSTPRPATASWFAMTLENALPGATKKRLGITTGRADAIACNAVAAHARAASRSRTIPASKIDDAAGRWLVADHLRHWASARKPATAPISSRSRAPRNPEPNCGLPLHQFDVDRRRALLGARRRSPARCGISRGSSTSISRWPLSLMTMKETSPSPLVFEMAWRRAQGAGIADIDAQRLLHLQRLFLERLQGLDPQADALRPLFGLSRSSRSDLPGSSRSRYWLSASENSTASNWPDESEKAMMPILLPVRVLRSCFDVTVPASRPAVAPFLHGGGEIGEGLDADLLQQVVVGVERMGGEVEAQHLEFAGAASPRQPGRIGRQADLLRAGRRPCCRTCRSGRSPCWPGASAQSRGCGRARPTSSARS